MLSEARSLRDILSRDGVLERKTKKRWTLEEDLQDEQAWFSPSGIMVAKIPDIDPSIFQVMIEFLYTNEISFDVSEDHEDEGDPWLIEHEEEIFNDDKYFSDDDNAKQVDIPSPEESSESTPMKFIQKLFVLADELGCTVLKHAVEDKLYDEYLYSFTAEEVVVWADSHSCAFLKEKVMDKIIISKNNKRQDKSDFNPSDEWGRLQQELYLYEKEGCHESRYSNPSTTTSSLDGVATAMCAATLSNDNYYKVEYLRHRLLELGLDTDGSREMLEERLKTHLDLIGLNHFLPTKLTRKC